MAEVTAALVKELREKTGAGMMDCKKALAETGADLEQAVDWLRKKGLAAAAKKAGRVAAEGLVGVTAPASSAAIVEVNAETDFVARNETFQGFVREVAEAALAAGGSLDAVKRSMSASGRTIEEELTHLVATIGENMSLRRAAALKVEDGVVATYMHSAVAPNLGKIGVLVALTSTGDKEQLLALGKQIAMHVAATAPLALDIASLDPAVVQREREVQTAKVIEEGRPADKAPQIVEGRLRKFYEDNCLLEQLFVMDGKTKVSKVVADAAKAVGAPVALTAFERYALGAGIEKKEDDFAAEVAKLSQS